MRQQNKIELSVVITAHAEGIILHKTIAAVRRALKPLQQKQVSTEIILHCDSPSTETRDYLAIHADNLTDIRIFTNTFGNASSSRNFTVEKARGRYIAFIDGDDLMSGNWLHDAYMFLEAHEYGKYVAHSEHTLEFGALNALVIKHGTTNRATDTLLSVFANRWNAVIVAPVTLLREQPYLPVKPGYGYEDWSMNCSFIYRGVHNVLIPETVIFVRRKDMNSKWHEQRSSRSVLPANSLFAFDYIRHLKLEAAAASEEAADNIATIAPARSLPAKLKARALPILRKSALAERTVRKLYHFTKAQAAPMRTNLSSEPRIPDWLEQEWRAMHAIEKQLFPTPEVLATIPIYDSLTPDHYLVAEAYKKLVDNTRYDHYDYILFLPWLVKGGADLYAVNFANAMQTIASTKRVLVITTLPVDAVWQDKLDTKIDVLPFGTITKGLSEESQLRLLEQLIENSGAQYLHIINSAFAYDFVTSHEHYMRATQKHLIVTSFSQSTDATGRIFGYSHTHVPHVYSLVEAITSDNQAVLTMWANEYGFDPDKLVLHPPTVALPALPTIGRPLQHNRLRVLWAARLCPEKQPAILVEIGRLIKDLDITIEMYGQLDPDFDKSFLADLPSNVHYKGPFDGFFTLQPETYDAFLYTSLFDGMPNVILEAAAAKLPIVSSAVGGVPEFIESGTSGLLITDLTNAKHYAEALRTYYNNPNLLTEYADTLYNLVEKKHSEKAAQARVASFAKHIGYTK